MKGIEKHISELVRNQFPEVYREQGENFITFMQAYYEWLETALVQLTVSGVGELNVGDTVKQGNVSGTIIAIHDQQTIVVRVDTFDMFYGDNKSDTITPIQSNNGFNGNVLFVERFNSTYWARHLPEIRDIDKTIDEFILSFKNKYLTNVQFTTATNKQLFIKNALDFYRAKGTPRAIDLFFKLVYGFGAEIYTPSRDLFTLSDNEWDAQTYLEIEGNSEDKNFIGQTIRGGTSGSTAFVSSLIRLKKFNQPITILLISNLTGDFNTGEQVITTGLEENVMAKIVGSLSEFEVIRSDANFEVGEEVNVITGAGRYGRGRVRATEEATGIIRFELLDGGWGYTEDASVVGSDYVFTLADVTFEERTEIILDLPLSDPPIRGMTVTGGTSNATGTVIGTSEDLLTVYVNGVVGEFIESESLELNSQSVGTINQVTLAEDYYHKNNLIDQFEQLTQPLLRVVLENAELEFRINSPIRFYDSSDEEIEELGGLIVFNTFGDGEIAVAPNIEVDETLLSDVSYVEIDTVDEDGEEITLETNVTNITDITAIARVYGIDDEMVINYNIVGEFDNAKLLRRGDILYQTANINGIDVEYAEAIVERADFNLALNLYTVRLRFLENVFRTNLPFYRRNDNEQYVITRVSEYRVGVRNFDVPAIQDRFSSPYFREANFITNTNGTSGRITGVFSYTEEAEFEITEFSNLLTLPNQYSNTQVYVLANTTIDDTNYGIIESSPLSKSDFDERSIDEVLGDFKDITVGTISEIVTTRPGRGYPVDPFFIVYDAKAKHFERYDFQITYAEQGRDFLSGEKVGMLFDGEITNFIGTITFHDRARRRLFVRREYIEHDESGVLSTSADFKKKIVDIDANFNGGFSDTTEFEDVTGGESDTTDFALEVLGGNARTTPGVVQMRIIGEDSGVVATISNASERRTSPRTGYNARILAEALDGKGFVTAVDVINSGYAYIDNQQLILESATVPDKQINVRGRLGRQGISEGFYRNNRSFLSTNKYLQDNDYYQGYSYEVQTAIPFEVYRRTLIDVLHVAGTKPFGKYVVTSNNPLNINVASLREELPDFNILEGGDAFANFAPFDGGNAFSDYSEIGFIDGGNASTTYEGF